MKTALVLTVALLASGLVAVAPVASAGCPDPDHPCTPMPPDPLGACRGTAVQVAVCLVKERLP